MLGCYQAESCTRVVLAPHFAVLPGLRWSVTVILGADHHGVA